MTDLRFEEMTAVVTEVGDALGRATALALAARVARVVVADDRTNVASRLAHEIVARGGTAVAHRGGQGPESGRAPVERALQEWGAIDVLVHPAAASVAGPAATSPRAPFVGWAGPAGRALGQLVAYPGGLDRHAPAPLRAQRLACGHGPLAGSLLGWRRCGDQLRVLGLMNVLKVEGAEHDLKINMVVPGAAAETGITTHLVTYLAHRDCKPTGEVFTVSPDGVARSFIGVNGGIIDLTLRVEAVRERLDEILSPENFIVPDQAGEEIDLLMKELR